MRQKGIIYDNILNIYRSGVGLSVLKETIFNFNSEDYLLKTYIEKIISEQISIKEKNKIVDKFISDVKKASNDIYKEALISPPYSIIYSFLNMDSEIKICSTDLQNKILFASKFFDNKKIARILIASLSSDKSMYFFKHKRLQYLDTYCNYENENKKDINLEHLLKKAKNGPRKNKTHAIAYFCYYLEFGE